MDDGPMTNWIHAVGRPPTFLQLAAGTRNAASVNDSSVRHRHHSSTQNLRAQRIYPHRETRADIQTQHAG